MRAAFVELPAFQRHRASYMSDEAFIGFQNALLINPYSGSTIKGTGGLRKLRVGDPNRGKGKRGGIRVIYFWWQAGNQFWLFTLYDKGEMDDLRLDDVVLLHDILKNELEKRS